MAPVRSSSTDGSVAPSAEMVQPSQLIPDSQNAYTFDSGPCVRSRPPVAWMRSASSPIVAPATLPNWLGMVRLLSPGSGLSTRAVIGTVTICSGIALPPQSVAERGQRALERRVEAAEPARERIERRAQRARGAGQLLAQRPDRCGLLLDR